MAHYTLQVLGPGLKDVVKNFGPPYNPKISNYVYKATQGKAVKLTSYLDEMQQKWFLPKRMPCCVDNMVLG